MGLALGAAVVWVVKPEPVPVEPPPAPGLSVADRAALAEFVERYFTTWSAKDIAGYGQLFHPNARVWFGISSPWALADFLESQRRAHAESPVPLTEKALSWDANVNNGLAHVRVYWELHRGEKAVRGYDFFTLVFSEGRWQIISLIFNEE